MTKEDLIKRIEFLVSDNPNKEMNLFAFEKNNTTPYKIKLTQKLKNKLIDLFSVGIKKIFIEDKEYNLVDYSKADERKGSYYIYDLETIPDALKQMPELIGETGCDDYDFAKNKFEKLGHFILVFSDGNVEGENKIVIYKHFSSVEKIIKSEKSFLGMFGDEYLEEFDKPLLRIGPKFQVIFIYPNTYILLNDKFIEQKLDLYKIMENEVKKNIHKLHNKNLLLDNTKLEQYKERDLSFCRKLVKVLSTSKILEPNISKQDIFNFIENDDKLNGLFCLEHNDNGEKFIKIKNKTMAKRFLNLLDDDFLYSKLTKQKYQVSAKDEI